MPLVLLVFHLVCIVLYDFDCPVPARSKFCTIFVILGSLVVQGISQSILCILGATLICPIVSAFIVICKSSLVVLEVQYSYRFQFIELYQRVVFYNCAFIGVIAGSLINYGVRLGWDSLMFYGLIKPKGRLPSGNSWLVKRIMGPGLAPDFYFEVNLNLY